MFGGGGINGNMPIPQSLEQLLERQWEQGSQFLMEQAQHFDSEYGYSMHAKLERISMTNSFLSLSLAQLLRC